MIPCLEPRGLSNLFEKLSDADFSYAVTGSFAANRYAPLAEPRLAAIYAGDPSDAMKRLGLRPADAGANVVIGQPFDPVVFDRTECDAGVTYARVTQVAADLMTGPGRGPAEGEGLIEWMESNEEAWRLQSTAKLCKSKRAGLLDALQRWAPFGRRRVLVGAQAVYEYTRNHAGDYAVSPFTLDSDLALVPELLVEDPRIIDAMANAGYTLTDQPGIYRREDGVQVDLLVPEAVGGRKGRGAQLGVHGRRAARQVRGLEGAWSTGDR